MEEGLAKEVPTKDEALPASKTLEGEELRESAAIEEEEVLAEDSLARQVNVMMVPPPEAPKKVVEVEGPAGVLGEREGAIAGAGGIFAKAPRGIFAGAPKWSTARGSTASAREGAVVEDHARVLAERGRRRRGRRGL